MAHDYRLNPFTGALDIVNITEETHTIPINSPYIVRLDEVPEKTSPSTLIVEIDGEPATEVASFPAQGEFWPDYSCDVEEDANWNTGALLFNSADAGKTITVSYRGTGTLVDVEKTRALHGVVVFTESGTWKCPAGLNKIYLSMCGGGGGGASVYQAEGGAGGGGGGAQAYMKYAVTVTPHTTYEITVGVGGASDADGSASSFGELAAAGGKAGGSEGTQFFYQGGAAGGPGGTAGGAGAQVDHIPGAGGGCLLGPGANTGDCSCYGGGGAGAATEGSTSVSGGAGGPGVVIIEW